jgi:hypothetical protein
MWLILVCSRGFQSLAAFVSRILKGNEIQERKVSGAKFINKAIAGKLPSKTNKQISDKRKWLRGKSNAKTTKAQN